MDLHSTRTKARANQTGGKAHLGTEGTENPQAEKPKWSSKEDREEGTNPTTTRGPG